MVSKFELYYPGKSKEIPEWIKEIMEKDFDNIPNSA